MPPMPPMPPMGCTSSKEDTSDAPTPKRTTSTSSMQGGVQITAATAPAGNGAAAGGGGTTCHYCNRSFPQASINAHTVECVERDVSCTNPWCRKVLKKRELDAHMEQCTKTRQTRCAKCGDLVLAVDMAKHRDRCSVVDCPYCGEQVIPRILKYCPLSMFGRTHYTVGPFATPYLRERFLHGISSPVATSNAQFPALKLPLPSAASPEPPLTRDAFAALNQDQRKARVNFSVARIQNMWRWAKSRMVIEDLIFRLVYKEIDTKRESFSIFKANDRIMGLDDDEGIAKSLALSKSRSAAPVQALAPSAGHYFPTHAKDPITREVCGRVIADLTNKISLPYYAVWRIAQDTAAYFKTVPNVQRVAPPLGAQYVGGRWSQGGKVIVVGDLHGQLADLLHILRENGMPSDRTVYIFNGDFVDRGPQGFEVFITLCLLVLCFPNCVYLNRGNHECDYMNEEYGFDVEVQTKYDRNVYKMLQRCFINLPLCTLIGSKVLVVHGGLPRRGAITLADIDRINRWRQVPMPAPDQPEEDEIFQDLLWSDPQEKLGWAESERGVGVLFGPDISAAFMKANKLELIIRSHEECLRGYEEHHGKRVVTVFSASNYDGPNTNHGAFAVLVGDSAELSFHTHQVSEDDFFAGEAGAMPDAPPPLGMTLAVAAGSSMLRAGSFIDLHGGAGDAPKSLGAQLMGNIKTITLSSNGNLLQPVNRQRQTRDDVLRSIRERVFERRHKLLAYFAKVDRTKRGTVWKLEWTEAMRHVLNLDLPWFFLRPYITEVELPQQRINYTKSLCRFRTVLSDGYMRDWEVVTLANLHSVLQANRRRGKPDARAFTDRSFNYNEFCSALRQLDYNLSDNALFQLFVACDSRYTGVVDGSQFVQDLEEAANELEDDVESGANQIGRWDLDALEQFQRIVQTGRSQLQRVFGLEGKDRILTRERYTKGMKVLCRGMRKQNLISPENVEALWQHLTQVAAQPTAVTLDEFYMACTVRDRWLLEQAREWGEYMRRADPSGGGAVLPAALTPLPVAAGGGRVDPMDTSSFAGRRGAAAAAASAAAAAAGGAAATAAHSPEDNTPVEVSLSVIAGA